LDTGLVGKSVVVTGATANIGRAIALAFAQEGACLTLVGRDAAKGEEIAALARAEGAQDAVFHQADVRNRAAVVALVAEAAERFGGIDVLVNNVGGNTGKFMHFADSDPDSWQAEVDLNLHTVLLCTHAVLPHMRAQKSGRIVNIDSTAGEVGDYMLGVYSATKGAVHAFTRALALEVGEQNITVNCVAPGPTFPDDPLHTSSGSRFAPGGMFAQDEALARPELKDKLVRQTQLPRQFAKPAEIAAATVYLASRDAAFVTGKIHCIDGGALL
jgi:2-hydroxycyclohexanecarboxyl-CoA dehydrogenase